MAIRLLGLALARQGLLWGQHLGGQALQTLGRHLLHLGHVLLQEFGGYVVLLLLIGRNLGRVLGGEGCVLLRLGLCERLAIMVQHGRAHQVAIRTQLLPQALQLLPHKDSGPLKLQP